VTAFCVSIASALSTTPEVRTIWAFTGLAHTGMVSWIALASSDLPTVADLTTSADLTTGSSWPTSSNLSTGADLPPSPDLTASADWPTGSGWSTSSNLTTGANGTAARDWTIAQHGCAARVEGSAHGRGHRATD
jgi:hypothetical protein